MYLKHQYLKKLLADFFETFSELTIINWAMSTKILAHLLRSKLEIHRHEKVGAFNAPPEEVTG